MLKIKRNALLSALQGAKETFPDEFICLLRGEKQGEDWILSEVIIAPFSFYERHSSGFIDWYVPPNSSEVASFHSHPTPGTAFPSKQDLKFFTKMPFHLIASSPYGMEDANAFDSNGKKIEFEIIK